MGKTAFSGPVYGAKSLLWMAHRDNQVISTAVATFAGINVPAYEDWYVTELKAWRGSTGSTDFIVALVDDSTSVATVAITSSLAAVAGSTTIAATGGEFEGYQILNGSSLTLTVQNGNSSVVGSSDFTAWVYGFIRFIDSTRAS